MMMSFLELPSLSWRSALACSLPSSHCQAGAEYELARSRIDRSMLNHPTADNDRREGLAKIEALGCVLPDVELNYLGVDRVAHRNRAAEARSDDGVS